MKVSLPPMLSLVFYHWSKAGACRPYLLNGGEEMEGVTIDKVSALMIKADYLARTGVAFLLPVHPGDAPMHQATATGLQISETIRLFNQHVDEHRLFDNVQAQLKQQPLKAVEYRYLRFLEDPDFGFANVSPSDMLQHL
jgi:hypothetical protein